MNVLYPRLIEEEGRQKGKMYGVPIFLFPPRPKCSSCTCFVSPWTPTHPGSTGIPCTSGDSHITRISSALAHTLLSHGSSLTNKAGNIWALNKVRGLQRWDPVQMHRSHTPETSPGGDRRGQLQFPHLTLQCYVTENKWELGLRFREQERGGRGRLLADLLVPPPRGHSESSIWTGGGVGGGGCWKAVVTSVTKENSPLTQQEREAG